MAGKTITADENYIRDGATQEGFIRGVPGLFGDEAFTYRPMLGQVAEEAVQKVDKHLDRAEYQLAYLTQVEAVRQHLVSWDRKEPIEPVHLMRVRRQVMLRMYEIIAGNRASDPRPSATPEANKPAEGADELLKKYDVTTGSASPTQP